MFLTVYTILKNLDEIFLFYSLSNSNFYVFYLFSNIVYTLQAVKKFYQNIYVCCSQIIILLKYLYNEKHILFHENVITTCSF